MEDNTHRARMSTVTEPVPISNGRDDWERIFRDELYSMDDLLDNNRYVGVKYSPYLAVVEERLSPRDRVLEAGCGRAQWVQYLGRLGVDVVGIDLAVNAMRMTRKLYPGLALVGGDLNRLCFPDSSFDKILCWSVIDHIESGPDQAVREIHRVLRTEGVLFITVPCRNLLDQWLAPAVRLKELISRSNWLRVLLKKDRYRRKFFQYEFSKSQLLKILRVSGFRVKRMMPHAQEAGFARSINRILLKDSRVFHKNKSGPWEGLDRSGRTICRLLMKISSWSTPDEVFAVAVKR